MERIRTMLTPLNLRSLDRANASTKTKHNRPVLHDDEDSLGDDEDGHYQRETTHSVTKILRSQPSRTQRPSSTQLPSSTQYPDGTSSSDDDDASSASSFKQELVSSDDEDDDPKKKNSIQEQLMAHQGEEDEGEEEFATPRMHLTYPDGEKDTEATGDAAAIAPSKVAPFVSPPKPKQNKKQKIAQKQSTKGAEEKQKETQENPKEQMTDVANADKTRDSKNAGSNANTVTPKAKSTATKKPRQKRATPQQKANEHYLVLAEKLVSMSETHLKVKNDRLQQTKRELKKAMDLAKKAQEEVKLLEERLEKEKEDVNDAKKGFQFAKRQIKETEKRIKNADDDRTRKEEGFKTKLDEAMKNLKESKKRPLESRDDVPTASKKRAKKKKKAVVRNDSESESDHNEEEDFSDSDDEEFVMNGKSFAVDMDASPKRSSGRDKSWTCSRCTFINKPSDSECPMCNTSRHAA